MDTCLKRLKGGERFTFYDPPNRINRPLFQFIGKQDGKRYLIKGIVSEMHHLIKNTRITVVSSK